MSRESRLRREKKTIQIMLRAYCRHHHSHPEQLCPECSNLLDYALARIDMCAFKGVKPTCAICPVHCYSPSRRDEIRAVMRYAGPGMLYRHPCLAIAHLIDGARIPRE